MEQKLILVKGSNFSELIELMGEGWAIKQISSGGAIPIGFTTQPACYILLERPNAEGAPEMVCD